MHMLRYSRTGAVVDSRTWLGKIGRLSDDDRLDEALHSADLSDQRGLPLCRDDAYRLLQVCTRKKDLVAGKRVQSLMADSGLDSVPVLGDHLVRLFALCGSLHDAMDAFQKVSKPTVYTWNGIIAAHIKAEDFDRTLQLYHDMLSKCLSPDRITFLCALKACSILQTVDIGRKIHGDVISNGLKSDVVLANMIIHMYSKCGSLKEARLVFDELQHRDKTSWDTMIACYTQNGQSHLALLLYKEMQQEGIEAGEMTFSSVLKACGNIRDLGQGSQIDAQIRQRGLLKDIVIGSALVNMYVECGKIDEARTVFDRLRSPDMVLWGTLISGYAQQGHGFLALELFNNMQEQQIEPDKCIYLSVLKACSAIGAIKQGRRTHHKLIQSRLESDAAVGNALIHMYVKCANLHEARKVFLELCDPDIVSWGAVLSGHAQCGDDIFIHQCLMNMQDKGFKPDDMLFTSILAACSYAGLLKEGCYYFQCMIDDYGIMPSIEHYNCMVDLFCRAGCLDEAEALLKTLPLLPDMVGWTSLLASCKTYNKLELAKHCLDQILQLNSKEAASVYDLISKLFVDW